MRKMLFAGLAALFIFLVLPGAVSAATSDIVVVSGSIGGAIDVSVVDGTTGNPAGTLSFGAMSGTKTDLTSRDLKVVTTYAKWQVDAEDKKTTNKGYMVDTTAGKLTNKFQLSNNPDTTPTWKDMDVVFTKFFEKTSAGAGTWTNGIGFQQVIAGGDPAGTNYQITITFTGAAVA
jgi:hypothetical protein